MSQAYTAAFAKIYNQRWIRFAQQAAPLIREFYGSLPVSRNHRTLLDLCCGTGQLASHFLENGYVVSGIDLSSDMLAWARENNLPCAYTRITGFSRLADGNYERFEETAFNSAFDIQEVQDALIETGFRSAYSAKLANLALPVEEPEKEPRIFLVAQR